MRGVALGLIGAQALGAQNNGYQVEAQAIRALAVMVVGYAPPTSDATLQTATHSESTATRPEPAEELGRPARPLCAARDARRVGPPAEHHTCRLVPPRAATPRPSSYPRTARHGPRSLAAALAACCPGRTQLIFLTLPPHDNNSNARPIRVSPVKAGNRGRQAT